MKLIDMIKRNHDYSSISLWACKMTLVNNDYHIFNNYRLQPGSTKLESLDTWNDGGHDAKDAERERSEAWPESYQVSYMFLINEIERRKNGPVQTCGQPGCNGLAYGVCQHCDRAACLVHHKYGDFEHWCLPCWQDYVHMLKLDGQVNTRDYKKAIKHITTYLH